MAQHALSVVHLLVGGGGSAQPARAHANLLMQKVPQIESICTHH